MRRIGRDDRAFLTGKRLRRRRGGAACSCPSAIPSGRGRDERAAIAEGESARGRPGGGTWAEAPVGRPSPEVMVELNDCGKWLEARQAKQAWTLQGYVVGMLTGMSMASNVPLLGSSQQDAIRNEQIYFWFDEYCKKNPLKYIEEATVVLANEVSHNAYQQAINPSGR